MEGFSYNVIRLRRKTISIVVKDRDVCVRAPYSVTEKAIDDLVKSKSKWIKKQIEKQTAKNDLIHKIEKAQDLILFGKSVSLKSVVSDRDRKRQIEKIFKSHTQYLIDRTDELGKKFCFTYGNIKLGNARTLWGTCDSKNNIRLNWRLLMLPIKLSDYVIVHELSHTKQHNHSKRFWAVVEKILPDYKLRKKALAQYSWVLDIYR